MHRPGDGEKIILFDVRLIGQRLKVFLKWSIVILNSIMLSWIIFILDLFVLREHIWLHKNSSYS